MCTTWLNQWIMCGFFIYDSCNSFNYKLLFNTVHGYCKAHWVLLLSEKSALMTTMRRRKRMMRMRMMKITQPVRCCRYNYLFLCCCYHIKPLIGFYFHLSSIVAGRTASVRAVRSSCVSTFFGVSGDHYSSARLSTSNWFHVTIICLYMCWNPGCHVTQPWF